VKAREVPVDDWIEIQPVVRWIAVAFGYRPEPKPPQKRSQDDERRRGKR